MCHEQINEELISISEQCIYLIYPHKFQIKWGVHWSQQVSNCDFFCELGLMFTRSVRVNCSFLVCWGESIKYEACLTFLRPLPNLVTDPKFIHLAPGLSTNLTACWLPFPACWLMKQTCLY